MRADMVELKRLAIFLLYVDISDIKATTRHEKKED